eukprot:CAMPEP_0197835712 /NCGR_PEP_ID=MMETSP1437-20131217/26727_1 /TAXON_ID=49252 ORGANISM="Eucampia antarctica, Strain CCMP1452" /NCGR_SAMPLE_ID=MMETSP1437 /ASSEMBLY_ACC=CAM_ASM_001096 /LENGTH=78 /DNA_ID=CAMNT_0043441357 /DNA_START=118 /DNA_END=351 /DNA_ORIENTATION=-
MNHVAAWLAQHWALQSSSTTTSFTNYNNNNVVENNNNVDNNNASAGWSSWVYGKTSGLVISLFAQLDLVDGHNDDDHN